MCGDPLALVEYLDGAGSEAHLDLGTDNARMPDRVRKLTGKAPDRRNHDSGVGEIIAEWRARSNRNGGRDHSGIVGDIERNQPPGQCNRTG
jgi:hypothetical protein